MDDSEKYLSIYQHQNCLKLFNRDMSEDDSLYKSQIPQLISNSNMIDPHHEEVNKFFKSYLEEKFTAKDYKLLKGVL